MVYFELFNQFVAAAAERSLAVDFFSTDAPDCWNTFIGNRSCYLSAFTVGVHRGNVSRGMFERLASLPDLIAIDEIEDLPARHLVSMDNYEGGRLAARHLLRCGCRNIVMLGGKKMILPFQRRRAGFEDELKKHPRVRYRFTVFGGSTYEQLQPGNIDELWQCICGADGVFCYCDLLALHVLAAAHYHNRHIPEDLSVIGFDGIAVGRHTCPKLTSVEHPARPVVEAALDLGVWLAGHPGAEPRKRLLCGRLLPGETTKILFKARKD